MGLHLPSGFYDAVYIMKFGAGNETRTRDIHVGNVVLYQLSYSRLGVAERFDTLIERGQYSTAMSRF